MCDDSIRTVLEMECGCHWMRTVGAGGDVHGGISLDQLSGESVNFGCAFLRLNGERGFARIWRLSFD